LFLFVVVAESYAATKTIDYKAKEASPQRHKGHKDLLLCAFVVDRS
jgi:hypothetical protein